MTTAYSMGQVLWYLFNILLLPPRAGSCSQIYTRRGQNASLRLPFTRWTPTYSEIFGQVQKGSWMLPCLKQRKRTSKCRGKEINASQQGTLLIKRKKRCSREKKKRSQIFANAIRKKRGRSGRSGKQDHLVQTWDLSKNLHDRRFQGKNFTQKTRNFGHLLNHDKKCVNALNWDKTSKKCSVTM